MTSLRLPDEWQKSIGKNYNLSELSTILQKVEEQYDKHPCFPEKDNIFRALFLCPLKKTKVIILGQDPYHGFGQANGLAFSVNDGISFPPSLVNIFKEIENDLGIPLPISGNLERWAEQGVLLLNTTLTVQEGKAGSHQKIGWEPFTDALIQTISTEKENLVFLLWGGHAKRKEKLISTSKKHLILTAGHPSPLSANRGYWFGNKHFSQTNTFLTSKGLAPIQW